MLDASFDLARHLTSFCSWCVVTLSTPEGCHPRIGHDRAQNDLASTYLK
jgi:hypothetical protein